MKKLILIALLFLGFSSYAQDTYEIYNNPYGLQSLTPSEVIVPQSNGNYNVYKVKNGLTDIIPVKVIEPTRNNENYNIYNITSGFQDLVPNQTIKRK